MKNIILTSLSALALTLGAVGCSSSSNSDGSADDGATGDNITLYGLTTGTNCFDVVSIAPGFNDGCMIGVDGLVGMALPVDYAMSTATVTVGNSGSLGAGTVTRNMGTLTRSGQTSDSSMPSCTWMQMDTSHINITATNTFTLAVTEVQSNFATACSAATIPTGGTCTSTWTWTMMIGTKTPPACN